MIDKPRKIALNALYDIEQKNSYSNIILNKLIKENQKELSKVDIAFISEIVYGVTYWKLTLDETIKKYSKINLKKISPWIINILRMGVYQIIFLSKVPKSAAVNESVNLAKRYGHKASSNFVNAILRKIEKADYKELFKKEDQKEKISKTTSTPEWIIEELLKTRNINEVEKICTAFTNKPNITIRINNLKISNNKLKEELKKKNIKYSEFYIENSNSEILRIKDTEKTEPKCVEEFLELTNLNNIEKLNLFKQGYFTIQDISAGFTVKLLSPKKSNFILDACAAPGGKTTFIAEKMENQGKIIALDIYPHRLKLIEENAKRLGINIIEEKIQDVTKENQDFIEKFDKILLDVPCMGIGVIKRKPDIKWQRKKEDLRKITQIQYKILETCSKYLKTGGDIVYSTCSIFAEENENIIKKFIEKNSNFKIENTEIKEMEYFKKFKTKEGYYIIDPTEKNDGFFMCKLTKIK